MTDILYKNVVNETGNFIIYYIRTKTTLDDAAKSIAIGQSIGNPTKRSEFESRELIEKYYLSL